MFKETKQRLIGVISNKWLLFSTPIQRVVVVVDRYNTDRMYAANSEISKLDFRDMVELSQEDSDVMVKKNIFYEIKTNEPYANNMNTHQIADLIATEDILLHIIGGMVWWYCKNPIMGAGIDLAVDVARMSSVQSSDGTKMIIDTAKNIQNCGYIDTYSLSNFMYEFNKGLDILDRCALSNK